MRAKFTGLWRGLWPRRRSRIAIAAILKNEAPYLLEWIAYHRVMGIEQFFIADNVSDDGTSELLTALDKAGVIRRLLYPGSPGEPPQLAAYDALLKTYGRNADWIAAIDCDEFLTPTDGCTSINDLLAPIETDPTVGAISVNWTLYGSSHQAGPTNEPVIARFSMRAQDGSGINKVYKTIVRTKAYLRPGLNPHYFELHARYRSVQTDGTGLAWSDGEPGVSAKIVWTRMRLNHYFVKSRSEFDLIKVPRGRADLPNAWRSEQDFVMHDANDLSDPMAEWLVTATGNEMENVRNILHRTGCAEELITMDRKIVERIEMLRSKQSHASP